jgi:hypothetical protein
MFPHINDIEFSNQVKRFAAIDAQRATSFKLACAQWISDATIARAAGNPLPDKPVVPLSTVVMQQGADPANPTDYTSGMYIWTVSGPAVGTCPDLPPLVATPAPTIVTIEDRPLSNEQMLGSISQSVLAVQDSVDALSAALKAKGLI